jgi:hypothetical protein
MWVQAGRRGECPTTPAKAYGWNETPRLNADIVRSARDQSYRLIRARLERGAARVLSTIDGLDDAELLQVGVFSWAGKWPVSRWISVNTARQYTTAQRSYGGQFAGTASPAPPVMAGVRRDRDGVVDQQVLEPGTLAVRST